MRNIAFPNLLKTFREYVLMTAGLLIYSFGWIACIKPMEVAAGGGTGLAMIVSHTAAEMWGVDIRIGTVFLTINAFLLLQGVETLSLRLDRHAENTKKVVEYLAGHPRDSDAFDHLCRYLWRHLYSHRGRWCGRILWVAGRLGIPSTGTKTLA